MDRRPLAGRSAGHQPALYVTLASIRTWLTNILRGIVVLASTIIGLLALAGVVAFVLMLANHRKSDDYLSVLLFIIAALVLYLSYWVTSRALQPWLHARLSDRGFQYLVAVALIASLLVSGTSYFITRSNLHETQTTLAIKRAELQKLAPIDAEVREYMKRKDHLQLQIDLINQLRDDRFSAVRGVETVASLGDDAMLIDGVAIRPHFDRIKKTFLSIVMRGRAAAPDAIDGLARKLNGEKTVATDRSFTVKVTR